MLLLNYDNLAEKGKFDQKQKSDTTEVYDAYMKTVATDAKGKYSEFWLPATSLLKNLSSMTRRKVL